MAENSKIEWCDHTVNLWWGCAKVHTGCLNCYAEHLSDTRYKNNLWGERTERKAIKSAWKDLDKYQNDAKKKDIFYVVFIGSMMDIFEDSKKLQKNDMIAFDTTNNLRNYLFQKIDTGQYPNLVFLFLTKRPQNIAVHLPNHWWADCPKNVWFGTSISDVKTIEFGSDLVKNTPKKANRFLSIEPQIQSIMTVDFGGLLHSINWVIQGGESGPKKRNFDILWAYQMKEACETYKVPYFFKQIDKIQEIPEDLQIREFPNFHFW